MRKIRYIILSMVLLSSMLWSATKADKISIQLQWLDQFQFAGYYIAKEKGFYEDTGLDVEIKSFDMNMSVLDEVTSNRATYGVGRSSLIIDRSHGAKIKLMAAIYQVSPLILMTTKESNISKLSDVKGKRMMSTLNSVMSAPIKAMMSKSGISRDDIVEQIGSLDIKNLINKKTDLMIAYISNEPFLLNERGIKYKIFDPKDFDFDFYDDILFTSEKEIKEHPQRAVDFRAASIEGWKYAFEHIDETVDIILSKYNPQNKSREALIYEANKLKELAYYKLNNKDKIGYIDLHKIRRIYDVYNIMGLVDSPINIDRFVYGYNKVDIKLTREQRAYLAAHPIIKAHNEEYWPPFNFNENGVAKGFSIDYINLLASKMGVKIEFVSGHTWSDYMEMLHTDKLDTIINIAYTKERAQKINFSNHFYTIQNVVYVNKNNANFHTLDDLEGHTIASVKDFYTQQKLAKERPGIKQLLVKDQPVTLKLLSLGKVDAVIAEKAIVDYLIQNSTIPNIVSTGFIEKEGYYAKLRLGTSKEDTILRDILDKAQTKVTKQEMHELKQKWFSIEYRDKNRLTLDEIQYINNKKAIKVCINPSWEPIEFYENNIPRGITIDTLSIIQKNIGIDFEFIKTDSWSQSQQFLKERKCDILPSSTEASSRHKYASYTNAYLNYDLAIVTTNDKPLVANLSSVIDKSISKKEDSGIARKLIKKYPNINILKSDKYEDDFLNVSSGKAYFTISTLPVLSYYKNRLNLDDLQISGYTNMKYSISMAVRNDDKELLNILNKALGKIDDSTHNIIFEKWTKKQIEFKTNYTLLWQLGIVSLLIIMVILFFMLRQKRLNTRIKELNKDLRVKVDKAIEETQRKEQLLQHQSRLAQMGEMISMIAHQWRQPLAAISATSSAMSMKAQLGKIDATDIVDLSCKISEYSQHLSTTIDDFREFFRPDKDIDETTYVELIDSILSIIENSILSHGITIEKSLLSTERFYTYTGEVKQVILNLMKNAEDALLENGVENPKITIETNGNMLIIRDNAGGVPEDILDKIFDPYFSTKTKKDGTGLGLYMSKTIIEEHCNGELSVTNDKHGAVFKIVL